MNTENASKRKIFGIEMPPDLHKFNFYSLFWCSMVMLIGITAPTVIQPIYLKEVIGIAAKNFGKINTTLVVMNEVASILLIGYVGLLSDKFGRRNIMTFGLVTSGITFILYGYAHNIAALTNASAILWVFVLRSLYAVFLQFAWPHVFTIIGDYTYESSRGKGMAAIGLTSALGSLVAFSVIGLIPRKFGILAAFYTCGIIFLLSGLVSHFGIIDRIVKSKESHHKGELQLLKEAWQVVKKSSPLKMCYGAGFVSRANVGVLGSIVMIWVVRAAHEFNMPSSKAMAIGGISVGISGIFGILTAPLWGILTDRWGRMRTISLSLGITGLGFLLLYPLESPFGTALKLIVVIIGAGQFGAMTASTTLATDLSPKQVLGSVLGGFNTSGALGIFILTSIGGFVFDSFGYTSPFLIVGIVNLAVCIWCTAIYLKYGEKSQ
ncbi:MAG: MFS transporter [Candidatus Schekmanbacteria bacterium]|nr:MAG: MFS transporter [Candidatus Schekmanbacteria bacterium]